MSESKRKVEIAKYFILSSPCGEVNDVIKDVQTLVGNAQILSPEAISAMLQEYNTTNFVTAQTPSGEVALVSPYNEVNATQYLDPKSGKVLTFDHTKTAFTGETDEKQVLPPQIDAYRQALNSAIKTLVEKQYQEGKVAAAVFAGDDGRVNICISAKNSRLRSFWTGHWRARYALDVSTKGQVDLVASVKINVHYFEDGNVQLNVDFKKTVKIQVAEPAATATNVAAAVEKLETDFQGSLEEMYLNMHGNTIKAMRRFLPITRQTMNWNSNAHNLANEVSQ